MRREYMSGVFDFWKKNGPQSPPHGSAPSPGGVDLYALLEVSPDASDDEINAAYRRIGAKYHPDRNPGNAEVYQKFLDASKAHDILTDRAKRDAYDRVRRASVKEDRPKYPYPSTYIDKGPHKEEKKEGPKPKPKKQAPWDVLFSPSSEKAVPIYSAFEPSEESEPTEPAWDVLFPERVRVNMPTRGELLAAVKKLPLKDIWEFIRHHRVEAPFIHSRSLVIGPVAGVGVDPVEHDLAALTGTSFDEIAAYVEQKGLHKAWSRILGPLADQAVLAIEHLKPEDLPGFFFMDWDPRGQALELLYTEPK